MAKLPAELSTRLPDGKLYVDCPFCEGAIIGKIPERGDHPISGTVREIDLISSERKYNCTRGINDCSVLEAYRAAHKH